MTLLVRDQADVEALVTDRYLESLFVAHERRAQDAPTDPELDPSVRRTAQRLSADLVRVHPSFRFEERLAARLADAAMRMGLSAAAGAEGAIVRLPSASETPPGGAAGIETVLGPDATTSGSAAFPRPLIIGGALTSAAISLAGAAFVAWRFGRPPLSPMARAVRAAQQARLARSRLD